MLEFKNVTKKYLRKTALDGVSFAVEDGRVCLLLGPNGSGKTTSMKLIAGLSRQTSGEVLFDAQRIGARTKAHIAYMPTENYFYSYMTIRDAGRYYADFFADFSLEHFHRLLTNMELDEHDKIRQLSSGMAAKLRLALTLSRDAVMMMFDEPLNGVDILTRTQTIDAILANRAAGRTMLISTHLVDELENVVDYVVFLRKGELVCHGTKAQICREKTLKDMYIDIYGHGSFEPETQAKEANDRA